MLLTRSLEPLCYNQPSIDKTDEQAGTTLHEKDKEEEAMKVLGKTIRQQEMCCLAIALLLMALCLNSRAAAQTNPLDSTPSKTDIVPRAELVKKLGAVRRPSTVRTASLP